MAAKSKLSFPVEDEDGSDVLSKYASPTPDFRSKEASPDRIKRSGEARTASPILSEISDSSDLEKERRVGPNKNLSAAPKVMTKAALLREAQTREKLRKDFLALQEAVKGTEIIVPFVFYDGTNIPGGKCKVKKRDFIWMLLDRCRRVGAGVGSGEGEMNSSRREWARIGVDDLLLVRGEVIIPHVRLVTILIPKRRALIVCSITRYTTSLLTKHLDPGLSHCSTTQTQFQPHRYRSHHQQRHSPKACSYDRPPEQRRVYPSLLT